MKTIIWLFFIFFITYYLVNVSAQNKPITWEVKAGVNFSNSSTTVGEVSYELNEKGTKTGFQICNFCRSLFSLWY